MADKLTHLIIEKGPGKGTEISVSAAGVRIGRSSNNDIVIKDPALSRFHCRIFFKPGEGLWAMDLGSANQTILNGKPLVESRIKPGDVLELGSTAFKVLSDAEPGAAAPEAAAGAAPPAVIDLNAPELFESAEDAAASTGKAGKPGSRQAAPGPVAKLAIFALGTLTVVLFVILGVTKLITPGQNKPNGEAAPGNAEAPASENIEIAYEKVLASPQNIFRYALKLKDQKLSIQLDDLANNKHVAGNQEKAVKEDLLRALAETVQLSEFFRLRPEYIGQLPNAYEVMELSITMGKRTNKVRVFNTLEPPEFKRLRELIEEFGLTELGLTSIALSPEELVALANESAQLGRRLYDQRDIKYENLAAAIRELKKTEWYVEAIEPKPDFYKDVVKLRAECEDELDRRYRDARFAAERAIKLREWEEAAKHLRIICDMIQDRSDERHEYARKKLVEMQQRLRK